MPKFLDGDNLQFPKPPVLEKIKYKSRKNSGNTFDNKIPKEFLLKRLRDKSKSFFSFGDAR